jgi:hypothetical protein
MAKQGKPSLVRKRKEIFIAKLDLHIDKTLLKESGSLSKNQLSDTVLAKIRDHLEKGPLCISGDR